MSNQGRKYASLGLPLWNDFCQAACEIMQNTLRRFEFAVLSKSLILCFLVLFLPVVAIYGRYPEWLCYLVQGVLYLALVLPLQVFLADSTIVHSYQPAIGQELGELVERINAQFQQTNQPYYIVINTEPKPVWCGLLRDEASWVELRTCESTV
uniref:Uncharacterized protein n=1 Tax=Entomoneis paludosa TaxID=265537 RepID=A0A7S2VCN6_9STRA|mmetsp:Transcript_1315/g.2883  ORF Transcript_1315/g.2883 Transcript_1315/m.2883 type:complete len:153 (+) Transcript_1315:287-745(+)